MRVALIIPARYASTRFPAKPLAPLTGATGVDKPLIRRSFEAAQAVRGVDLIAVATDDDRIAEAARGFGAAVLMTPETCANGTERCAAALPLLDPAPDLVVNLQGDAPLTPPWFVEALIARMQDDPACDMATPVLRCDADTLDAFRSDRRAGRVGGTTAVMTASGDALYFSKEVLPYGASADPAEGPPAFHHVGVYAYRPAALAAYARWPQGPLERAEGLEQLRFLERGGRIACVEVEARGAGFWELNNPTDRPRIEAELARRGTV